MLSFIAYVFIPTLGIGFFNWDWRFLLILYWLENITLGVTTVISIQRTTHFNISNTDNQANGLSPLNPDRKNLARFFTLHYGMFTLVHGIFIFALIAILAKDSSVSSVGVISTPINWLEIGIVWGLMSAFQIMETRLKPPHKLPSAGHLFVAPYGRIIPLHIAIIGGIMILNFFHTPTGAAILLVVIHFIADFIQLSFTKKPTITLNH